MPRKLPKFIPLVGILLAAVWGCGPTTPADDAGGTVNSTPHDAGSDSPERPSKRLRAATFNVGRFFDTICDSNNCDDGNDFEQQLSEAEFGFKADQIADAIERFDADAVMLQELETRECLDAVVERVPEYTVAEFGEIGGNASLDVALIVRGATHLETRTHRDSTQLLLEDGRTKRFARELLEVHVDLDGERVALFSAHYKARRGDDPEWRLAEAEATREIAEATAAEFDDVFVLLGGDLNDEPGSPPLKALTERGGLRLATRDLPESDSWTFKFFDDLLTIDHLAYVPSESGELVDGSPEVIRDPPGTLAGSDHAALTADFHLWLD